MARPRLVSRLLYAAGKLRRRQTDDDTELVEVASRDTGSLPDRPPGLLIWLHAKHPSETGVALAVAHELSRLRGEPAHALVTTTSDGAFVPAVRDAVIVQPVPGESTALVAAFLKHWAPDAAVALGPPDRPVLWSSAAEAGVPMFLAAAHRGDVSGRGRLPYLSTLLLEHFGVCLAASAADGEVYRRDLKPGTRLEITGPLSDTGIALTYNEAEREALSTQLAGRPVWLAAQILDEELDAVEAAQRRALQSAHRLLLIIVPRSLDAGPSIAAGLELKGWRTALRSGGGEPREDIQIYIADTEDELGLWYRLAPITFVGGSLFMGVEPSDPFDPAALGSVPVHGANTGLSRTRFERLQKAGAHFPVGSADDLGPAIQALLSPDRAAKLAHAGWAATTESAPVIERLAELMDIAIEERGAR